MGTTTPPNPATTTYGGRDSEAGQALTEVGLTRRDSAESLLRTTLAKGERVRLRVSGSCMTPLLKDGDHVVLQTLKDLPTCGAIVVARSKDDDLVCHRVLAVEGDRLILAGDRGGALERHGAASIFGQVCSIERCGRPVQLPGTPRGIDSLLARLRLVALRQRGTLHGRVIGRLHRAIVPMTNPTPADHQTRQIR